jgi:hypothetical protein
MYTTKSNKGAFQMNTTFNPYRRFTLILVLVLMFFAVVSIACDSTDLDCSAGPNACVNPANIVMGEKSDIEQAVGDFLAGDNPQNILSGGNP